MYAMFHNPGSNEMMICQMKYQDGTFITATILPTLVGFYTQKRGLVITSDSKLGILFNIITDLNSGWIA